MLVIISLYIEIKTIILSEQAEDRVLYMRASEQGEDT